MMNDLEMITEDIPCNLTKENMRCYYNMRKAAAVYRITMEGGT